MKKHAAVLACLAFSLLVSVQSKAFENRVEKVFIAQLPFQDDHSKAQSKTMKIISSEGGTYGYEIYSGGKLLIRQANIPGMSGNKGFRRKSDAEKVAKLVIEKLDKGIMPPTVEKAEMEKLKVQF